MIIGLTGLTGAGKSTAAEILRRGGCYIIDADKTGHRVINSPEISGRIKAAFGEEYVSADGAVDRRALGRLVFADGEKLRLLNAITHPAIAAEIAAEAEAHRGETVIIDCALPKECGLDKICDKILRVTAPAEVRLKRIMERDGLSRTEALNRMNSQTPYGGSCTDIDNSSGERELELRIKEALWAENSKTQL